MEGCDLSPSVSIKFARLLTPLINHRFKDKRQDDYPVPKDTYSSLFLTCISSNATLIIGCYRHPLAACNRFFPRSATVPA